ncbi:tRNA (cytosine(34)-C(5))-methyltransferase [Phlebotomus argentipes]|uniref:tRNA (cytosine(34)-C(5))-methyltransferase n=1 Tax=Phlebotomus argentipes TaxID=94469 RepID=UPI002892F739|nr:tRNA (cytosine(34)-C(5))-methyltransferase [Phlebotomus argentipes]
MGKRGKLKKNNTNPFAQKKRDRRNNGGESGQRPDRRSEPYEEIKRENESFFKYYKQQGIVPESEWETFVQTLQSNLPTAFRVTGCRGESETLLDIIKSEYFTELFKQAQEGEMAVQKPFPLPWYPGELAWQLQLSRKDIRRSEVFYKLHNFLIAETAAGSISRQETVSMIPPIVLDVKPHHRVLDMCAAPGSKTAQLIEALHAEMEETKTLPTGLVIANDIDNSRCYMLVHQAKRLNSPCFLVTNEDSERFPDLQCTNRETGKMENMQFDRILCDVPCSGDATLRKNPDIWTKWNPAHGTNLNGVQFRIAKRGAELLTIGGRLVYSTCSFNPVENEAVIVRLLKESEGALELIDASNLVPGLKFTPGMRKWELAAKDMSFYADFQAVPEQYHTILRPQMFPPEDVEKYNLERCMRILPHQQDTGGFFVAVLVKTRAMPWAVEEEKRGSPAVPQRKKRRLGGYKEEPFVFFHGDEDIFASIKSFYTLREDFQPTCLLTRCHTGKKKNIYFSSESIRDIVQLSGDRVKIINTGVKVFVRCDNKNMSCAFRLAQEGLPSVNEFVGSDRRVLLERSDLVMLLQNTDPTKPPKLEDLTAASQERIAAVTPGSCVLEYREQKLQITLVGWRGTTSLRAYVDQSETVHMLRLLRADLSQYEVNKFRKPAEEEQKDDEKDQNGAKMGSEGDTDLRCSAELDTTEVTVKIP